jgi:hypothetical protein
MSAVAQAHDVHALPVKPGPQTSTPAAMPAPPADQERGYWGDWVVLQLWIICFALLGVSCLVQFVAGFWRQ